MKTIKMATLAALVLSVGLAACSTLKPLDPQRVSVDPQGREGPGYHQCPLPQ